MQKAVWFHWRLAALALSGRVACLVAVLVLLYDRHTSCEQNACIALITAAEELQQLAALASVFEHCIDTPAHTEFACCRVHPRRTLVRRLLHCSVRNLQLAIGI